MINSKQKGARFERALARMFREQGYDARRTQQYCGATEESSDVIGLPYIHVEAKHYKQKAFDYEWMDQAKRDAKGKLPTVFHKTDNHEVLVTMTLDDWFTMYREYEAGQTIRQCEKIVVEFDDGTTEEFTIEELERIRHGDRVDKHS